MRKSFKIVKLLALRQGTSERTGQEWKSREVVSRPHRGHPAW